MNERRAGARSTLLPQVEYARHAVSRLILTRFRSYETARVSVQRSLIAVTGPNGAGKTNLLEALSLLTPGRGLRRARLPELTRVGATEGWAVAATVMTAAGSIDIGTGAGSGAKNSAERRTVHIDGRSLRGQTALAQYVAMVWLTPPMDRLFQEGGSGRRRFLDRLVFGFDPAHAGRLNRYDKALRERARLLSEGRGANGQQDAWLDGLENEMATSGVAIAAARLDLARRLTACCLEAEGPFPAAIAQASGDLENWLLDSPALTVEDRTRQALRQSRSGDAEAGMTRFGPHRSDFLASLHMRGSTVSAAMCSTGEQKALLISLVLATASLIADERGHPPILLLDEVAAYLDPNRRSALFERLRRLNAQVWMTGADPALFSSLGDEGEEIRLEAEDCELRAASPNYDGSEEDASGSAPST